MKKCVISLMVITVVMVLAAIPVFSQGNTGATKEEKAPAATTPAPQAAPAQVVATAPAPAETPKAADLSIYGEIQAVNVATNSMSIQYYDYDNDEEKTLEIATDGNTKLENVKSVGDIKKGDWADVTYTNAGGKNTAKMLSVEKEEPATGETAPATAEE